MNKAKQCKGTIKYDLFGRIVTTPTQCKQLTLHKSGYCKKHRKGYIHWSKRDPLQRMIKKIEEKDKRGFERAVKDKVKQLRNNVYEQIESKFIESEKELLKLWKRVD